MDTIEELRKSGYTCTETLTKKELFNILHTKSSVLKTGGQDRWNWIVKSCDKLGAEFGQPGDEWFHCKSPFWPLAEREFIALVREGEIIQTIMLRMS